MAHQQGPNPPHGALLTFSPPTQHRQSIDMAKPGSMDLDSVASDYDRSKRAASVLSGLSMEDMEAAETLNSLHQKYSSPQQHQGPPVHIHTSTSFDANQPEPLLRLFTSQYPFAGKMVKGSLSAYKTTQAYIPLAGWTERNVGLPIAGTVARISGVEAGVRWYLNNPKRDDKASSSHTATPDIEKGQPGMQITYTETLPAYDAGDRSPPYSESTVAGQSNGKQPPPGWRQQLVISTSGLGIAMSEESLRSLRYCLSCLRWANGHLGEAIQNIRALLERWNEGIMTPGGDVTSPMSVSSLTNMSDDQRQAVLRDRIAALKKDVLETLKHVVGIVSNYAGGALPENARNLVHRHLTSLPERFSIANAISLSEERESELRNGPSQPGNEAAMSAGRVMLLAQEGLDMMTQVSRVVNDTLMSAEGWCEKLGRKTGKEGQSYQRAFGMPALGEKQELKVESPIREEEGRERSETVGGDGDGDVDGDVKMEM